MFIVKSHESVNGKKTDTKVLTVGNNVTEKYVFINTSAGELLLLKFLNNRGTDNGPGLIDGIGIMFLSSTDNNTCQKFMELVGHNDSRNDIPQSETKVSGTCWVTEAGSAFYLPRVATAF